MTAEAVLYVRELAPLAAFYRDCLGLSPGEPGETGEDHCVLRCDGLVLWLVRGRQAPGADRDRDGAVRRRSEVPVKLAFEVASIERVAGSIEAFGGAMAPGGRPFAGYRRRDAVDPEGNVIQLLEPLGQSGAEAGPVPE